MSRRGGANTSQINALNQGNSLDGQSSLFNSQSILEHQNKSLAKLLINERAKNRELTQKVQNCENLINVFLKQMRKADIVIQEILLASEHNTSQNSTNQSISPSQKNLQNMSLSDFIQNYKGHSENKQFFMHVKDICFGDSFKNDPKTEMDKCAHQLKSQLENIVKHLLSNQENKIKDCNFQKQRSDQMLNLQNSLDDMILKRNSVPELQQKIQNLELKIENQSSRVETRNSNYYRSIVKEFFPKDVEKHRNAICASSQLNSDAGDAQAQRHECFCNMCGDDISKRAKDIADLKFQAFKKDFEIQNLSENAVKSGQTLSQNNQVSDKNLECQIKQINLSHQEQLVSINDDLEASKRLSAVLIEEIEKYKTQKFLSEHNIQNSQVVSVLRNEVVKMLDKIEHQNLQINQLKIVENSYMKLKNEKESTERATKIITSQQVEKIKVLNNLETEFERKILDLKNQISELLNRINKTGANVEMKKEDDNSLSTQIKQLMDILKSLKIQSEIEKQREEFRKKYENYKKMFMNEKSEKEAKIKELQIFRSKEEPIDELKELKAKYENLKELHQKEYMARKEKEQKMEQCNLDLQKKNQALDDLYGQFDQLYESIGKQEDQISSLQTEKSQILTQKQSSEAKIIQLNLELTKIAHNLQTSANQKSVLQAQNNEFNELKKNWDKENCLKQNLVQQQGQLQQYFDAESQKINDQKIKLRNEKVRYEQILAENKNSIETQRLQVQKSELELQTMQQREQLRIQKEADEKSKKILTAQTQQKPTFGEQGISFSKDDEIEYLKHEVTKLKIMVNCSSCEINPKQLVLPCGHLFCQDCIQKQIAGRKRNCPICREKFTANDPFKVFLDEAEQD